ncbi:hypothetical protein H9Q73_013570 [Fusarium xylarioides]|nr:hypothetical protein H9Q73_013570 [Fusarium xylarioides]
MHAKHELEWMDLTRVRIEFEATVCPFEHHLLGASDKEPGITRLLCLCLRPSFASETIAAACEVLFCKVPFEQPNRRSANARRNCSDYLLRVIFGYKDIKLDPPSSIEVFSSALSSIFRSLLPPPTQLNSIQFDL